MTSVREKISSDDAKQAGLATIDMKLEVIVIPVSDAERAEQFYRKLGWRQDVTPPGSGVFQFTPHGSACSVQFGKNLTSAAPGSVQRTYLIVSDIEAARNALVDAGIEVSEIFHFGPNGPVSGPDPERRHLPLARLVQRSRRQQLAAAGDHDASARAHRLGRDFVRLRKRSGKRASACRGRAWRAREAHRRAARRELARLVRRVHGGGAIRHRVTAMKCLSISKAFNEH